MEEVTEMRRFNRKCQTSPKTKKTLKLNDTILEVSSGFSAGEALNFIVPKGFILPVIPGTQHATIGGMIAADIHGKNHTQNGTLGKAN